MAWLLNFILTNEEGYSSLIRIPTPATVLELICSRSPRWLLPLTVCGPSDLCDCDGATAREPSPSAPLILPVYPTAEYFVFVALSRFKLGEYRKEGEPLQHLELGWTTGATSRPEPLAVVATMVKQ